MGTRNRLRLRASNRLREHSVSKSCLPSNVITGKSSTIEKSGPSYRATSAETPVVTRTPLLERTGKTVDALVENSVDNIDRTRDNRPRTVFLCQLPGENVPRIRQRKLLGLDRVQNIRSSPKGLRSQLNRSNIAWNVDRSMS